MLKPGQRIETVQGRKIELLPVRTYWRILLDDRINPCLDKEFSSKRAAWDAARGYCERHPKIAA